MPRGVADAVPRAERGSLSAPSLHGPACAVFDPVLKPARQGFLRSAHEPRTTGTAGRNGGEPIQLWVVYQCRRRARAACISARGRRRLSRGRAGRLRRPATGGERRAGGGAEGRFCAECPGAAGRMTQVEPQNTVRPHCRTTAQGRMLGPTNRTRKGGDEWRAIRASSRIPARW